MKLNLGVLVSAIISAGVLSGCAAYGQAYIPAPPPPQVEVVGVAPYPEAIWVPGYWHWERGHREYRWEQGYWRNHRDGRRYEHR